jgi:hypothetical protein
LLLLGIVALDLASWYKQDTLSHYPALLSLLHRRYHGCIKFPLVMRWHKRVLSESQFQRFRGTHRNAESAPDATLRVSNHHGAIQSESIHLASIYTGTTACTLILINGHNKAGDRTHGNDAPLDALNDAAVAITTIAHEVDVFAGIAGAMYKPRFFRTTENIKCFFL